MQKLNKFLGSVLQKNNSEAGGKTQFDLFQKRNAINHSTYYIFNILFFFCSFLFYCLSIMGFAASSNHCEWLIITANAKIIESLSDIAFYD